MKNIDGVFSGKSILEFGNPIFSKRIFKCDVSYHIDGVSFNNE